LFGQLGLSQIAFHAFTFSLSKAQVLKPISKKLKNQKNRASTPSKFAPFVFALEFT